MTNLAKKIAVTNKLLNDSYREYLNEEFETIKTITTPYGDVGSVIYHMMFATNVWLNRISKEKGNMKPYTELKSKDVFFEEWLKADTRFVDFTSNNSFDYAKIIDVKTLDGQEFKLSVEDILLHISHHSFLHRGHLGAIIRINNLKPLPGLDWVDANIIE